MLHKGAVNRLQIKRNEACIEHAHKNVGPNYAVVFGKLGGGVVEIEGESVRTAWDEFGASTLPQRYTGWQRSTLQFVWPLLPFDGEEKKAILVVDSDEGRTSTPQEPCAEAAEPTLGPEPVPPEAPVAKILNRVTKKWILFSETRRERKKIHSIMIMFYA